MQLHRGGHARQCFSGSRRDAGIPHRLFVSVPQRQAPAFARPCPQQQQHQRCTRRRSPRQQRVAVAAPEAAAAAAEAPEAASPAAAAAEEDPATAAAAAAAAPREEPPKLSNLELQAIINPQGRVAPSEQPGAAAAVFAVYDAHQKLQYIGFSRALRASLRTVLGRRPDKAYYFKAVQLSEVDQEAMLAIRQAWFDECGAPPPGNKLALERKAWQSAVDAGAISARAKPTAAAEKAKELQGLIRGRGCVEAFTPDPELMQEGQVDFLTDEQQPHNHEQQQQQPTAGDGAAAAVSSSPEAADGGSGNGSGDGSSSAVTTRRTAGVVVDGQAKQFGVEYLLKFPTKGGYMMDVKLSFDHMDTTHRVIVGKAYYEPYGLPPEAPVEAALALLLARKLPRHNEGMLGTAEFPVNYFTVSEVEQWFGEEFAAQFMHTAGHTLQDGMSNFWRMNKIHDYGAKLEDPASLGAALNSKGLGRV